LISSFVIKKFQTYGILDGTDNRELDGTADSYQNWLMAISEQVRSTSYGFFHFIFSLLA
jgi:hypothetical protein